MLRLVILIIVVALGVGFYFGVFNTDDSVNDIVNKSKEIASKKADELKEKAIDKANDLTKEALKKADELKEETLKKTQKLH
jgi:uncharacterized protein (UPF0333 family)